MHPGEHCGMMRIVRGREFGVMTVAAIAVAVIATLVGSAASIWVAVSEHKTTVGPALETALVLSFTAVGAVIIGARPRNLVGWFLLAAGATWALGGGGADLAEHGIVADPGSVPAVAVFALVGAALRSVGWYLLTLVMPAYFPDGRLASPRQRWLKPALIFVVVSAVVDPLTDKQADMTGLGQWHNPIAPGHPWDAISGVAFLGHVPFSLVVVVGIIIGLRYRWRRGDAVTRQQLLLFFGAVVLPVVAAPLALTLSSTGGWVFAVAAIPLPFAIGFAVLAKGLYDLRTAANRTLVWVTLTAVVTGLYALVIAGLGDRIDARGATWLAWVAAAIVALIFAPLRDVLQRAVNRLTYGRWDEPYDVLAALGQRLEATADAQRLLDDVVSELHALGLTGVAIRNTDGRVLAGDAATDGEAGVHALAAFGRSVGTLVYEQPNPPLRGRDRRLLEDLAGHLGGVLHAYELTADLQRALERQVLTREEERRRLRRDLHDGLGPALAGHVLRLDAVSAKLGGESAARDDVEALRRELRGTMVEVRRVVEGLRPPAIDDLGLTGALQQAVTRLMGGSGMDARVDIGELPPLPAAMEIAVYRIITEAVTNVVRHAGATRCEVSLRAADGVLRLSVTDDGRGIVDPRVSSGHGLQTMRERTEELRGRFDVSSEHGTVIVAELPLPPTPPTAPRATAPRTEPHTAAAMSALEQPMATT
jgi:signal transduction histidine kinase